VGEFEFRMSDSVFRIEDCVFRTLNSKLRIPDFAFRNSEFGMRDAGFGMTKRTCYETTSYERASYERTSYERTSQMKYDKFEDLPVWRAAIELGRQVYALTDDPAFKNRYSLRDQIERAAVSVSNNIAEGFERGTNQELLSFLYIARGSAGEVRSMLHLLEGMPAFRNLESEFRNLCAQTDSISKQLGAWARTLQDSGLKGRRYVNEKTRRTTERARGREEFLKRLEEMRNSAAAQRQNQQSGNGGEKGTTGDPDSVTGGSKFSGGGSESVGGGSESASGGSESGIRNPESGPKK